MKIVNDAAEILSRTNHAMDKAILGVGYGVEYLNVLLIPLCSNITLTHIWGPPHNRAKISQILYMFHLFVFVHGSERGRRAALFGGRNFCQKEARADTGTWDACSLISDNQTIQILLLLKICTLHSNPYGSGGF